MYRHVLIPTDGSLLSGEAVRHGVELAAAIGARVLFVTVSAPFHTFSLDVGQVEDTRDSYRAHVQERGARILDEAGRVAAAAGVVFAVKHVEDDQPYRAIIREAEEHGCDLIAMASHGRRGISALVLGSETVKVLTHTAIPVLVYRAVELHGAQRYHEGQELTGADDA
jgi:nucleotide-binding universal stress UspA family protein